MAIKTFTTAEVLTAADTNTYLANSGLVFVSSTTVGSGVTSVTVSNCFSSTYDSYRIVWSGIDCTTLQNLTMQLTGLTGSTYSTAGFFMSFGTATVQAFGPAATTNWVVGPTGSMTTGVLDIFNPFSASIKTMTAQGIANASSYVFNGVCTTATSATGFSLSITVNTMTGGKVTVYGYRKA
jgi:hypothetical protein